MKPIPTIILTCAGCLAFSYNAMAQSSQTAVITGDSCATSTLVASMNRGNIKEIKWYRDTTLALVRVQQARFGEVVAGGNGPGETEDKMYDPKGVFVDNKYNVYVVNAQRVQKWAPGATTGVTVAGGNGKGPGLNQFASPYDVVVDKKNNIYVSDALTSSVRKWAPGAKTGVIVAGGSYGSGPAQLSDPLSICLDRFGNLYIADRWNARVQRWAPGATVGVTVAGGNGKGSAANQLYEPSGVGVDYAGNVYVSDPFNFRVQKWAPGATAGITVAGGNGQGNTARQLFSPTEMHVDSAGTIYVVDNARVVRWSPGADYGVTVVGGYGYTMGTGALDKMSTSYGLFVNGNKWIYVSDLFDARVRRFKPATNPTDEFSNAGPGNYKVGITTFSAGVIWSKPFKVLTIPDQPDNIVGPATVVKGTIRKFSVQNPKPDVQYTWTVPADAEIQSGQNTTTLMVKWGNSSGYLTLSAATYCGPAKKARVKSIEATDPVAPPPPVTARTATPTPVVNVYPNPTSGSASIAFEAKKQAKYEMFITNMMGKQVYRQTGSVYTGANTVDFNISNFEKGIYLISLKYNDGDPSLLKLSKE